MIMISMVFTTTLILAFLFSRAAFRLRLLDHPNTRSLHQHPTPRTGGLAMLGGFGVSGLLFPSSWPAFENVLLGLLPLAIISFLDDRYGIAVKWRILVHGWAAASLVLAHLALHQVELPGVQWILPEWAALVLTLLFTIWMINLYNFMDGMDGLAGGMALIGFTTLAWLGRADAGLATVCLTVAAVSAGFLVHNFPPARIFLGDTGSTTLGFLAAACSLWGSKAGLFPFWVALLVFSPFLVDATFTLINRLLRGERVWEAHRSHHYQRLALLGWGHRRTVLAEYALMLACAGSALLAIHLPLGGQAALIIGWLFVYALLMWAVGWLERRALTRNSASALNQQNG